MLEKLKKIGAQKLSIAFIAICFVILVLYLFISGEAAQLPSALSWPNSLWLLVGMASMIIGWLFEGWVLYEMARGLSQPIPYRAAVRSTMVVQLFNNITPSSSGGQPMQIWSLWRDGVPIGQAGSVMLGKFAVYQAALVTCGLVGVFFAYDLFATQIGGWKWLIIAGFAIQICIFLMLAAIIWKPSAVRKVVHVLGKLFMRGRFKRKVEHALVRVDSELTRFETDALTLAGHPGAFIRAYLLTIVQLQSVLIVPFCICHAIGGSPSLIMALSAAAATLIVSSSFPTPGASGGAEGTFVLIFSLLLPEGAPIGVGVLLWRMLSFYFPIVAGLPFCAGAPKDPGKQTAQKPDSE